MYERRRIGRKQCAHSQEEKYFPYTCSGNYA